MWYKDYQFWVKIAIIGGGLYFLEKAIAILLPVIIAVVLTFILRPLVTFFARRLPRNLAVFLALGCAVLVIGLVGTFVILPFINEFNKFVVDLPKLLLKIQEMLNNIEIRTKTIVLPVNVDLFIERVITSAASFSVDFMQRIFNFILNFATSVVELIAIPVLTYYFLRDGQLLTQKVINVCGSRLQPHVQKVLQEIATVISGYIRGQFVISLIIGVLVFSGVYFLGVAYPLVLGLWATCTEIIPIIGPIIGAVPAVLLAYVISPALGFKVVLFYIIIHQLENNIIVPHIMGQTISLHPAVIIISLLIGGQLGGIIGMMLVVPVTAVLWVLVKQVWKVER